MRTLAPDERMALENAFARLLADHSSETHVRNTMETPAGYDPALWQLLAEMGITGLLVDERFGGAGAGPIEIERVMEQAGAALLCSPLLASSILAASVVGACGDTEAQARLLPEIANGERITTIAITGDSGSWTPAGVEVSASLQDDNWSLNGVASYVLHADNARLLLVVANTANGQSLFEVEPRAAGVSLNTLPTFDHTLRMSRIEFSGTAGRIIGAADRAWPAVEAGLNVARVALAGEQAGGARKTLAFTVEYAKTRVQFGRAIGSFQAIKHMAADLLLESESAISAARHAADALASNAHDADAVISLAAFACAEAFSTVTATAVQMHGGIAFTWEHPAHLYLRRARAAAQLFGTPSFYRERYIQQIGG